MAVSFDNLFSIKGKVALVTGGSRGIGEMIAAGFLAQGAKVYISSRKAEACQATAERLMAAHGGECFALPADLSRLDGVTALAQALAARESKLDILVNNAGASWGAPLESFPEVGWDKVMDTNVKGVFFLTQALMPLLHAAASGPSPARVINIGSIDGLKSSSFDAWSYGASKAAVHHLTRFMAAKLTGERILCNAIAPGPYPTWMLSTGVGFGGATDGVDWDRVGQRNPSGRVGTPEDIAGLATFLCSRAGEYVVGQVIASDGGAVAAA
ncbi:MAG: 3-oxoacyl-ACP reductase [Burkholderiales bacterium RIFCSPHIGHO2_12_FULL_69_20]|nr:MAG: 3-oxoacyl-ACP reductase [Burkholderiales bacterium RIFCSPHIGHO2_12_FULL_69_20]